MRGKGSVKRRKLQQLFQKGHIPDQQWRKACLQEAEDFDIPDRSVSPVVTRSSAAKQRLASLKAKQQVKLEVPDAFHTHDAKCEGHQCTPAASDHNCSENNQGMPNTSAVTRGHDIDVKPCTCVSRDQSIDKKYPACTDEQVPLPAEVTPTMYWKVVPSSDRDLDGNNSYRQQAIAQVNQPLGINPPRFEGDFCGQVKQKSPNTVAQLEAKKQHPNGQELKILDAFSITSTPAGIRLPLIESTARESDVPQDQHPSLEPEFVQELYSSGNRTTQAEGTTDTVCPLIPNSNGTGKLTPSSYQLHVQRNPCDDNIPLFADPVDSGFHNEQLNLAEHSNTVEAQQLRSSKLQLPDETPQKLSSDQVLSQENEVQDKLVTSTRESFHTQADQGKSGKVHVQYIMTSTGHKLRSTAPRKMLQAGVGKMTNATKNHHRYFTARKALERLQKKRNTHMNGKVNKYIIFRKKHPYLTKLKGRKKKKVPTATLR